MFLYFFCFLNLSWSSSLVCIPLIFLMANWTQQIRGRQTHGAYIGSMGKLVSPICMFTTHSGPQRRQRAARAVTGNCCHLVNKWSIAKKLKTHCIICNDHAVCSVGNWYNQNQNRNKKRFQK